MQEILDWINRGMKVTYSMVLMSLDLYIVKLFQKMNSFSATIENSTCSISVKNCRISIELSQKLGHFVCNIERLIKKIWLSHLFFHDNLTVMKLPLPPNSDSCEKYCTFITERITLYKMTILSFYFDMSMWPIWEM